jgi:multiple sugar transport system substrate-binding protein
MRLATTYVYLIVASFLLNSCQGPDNVKLTLLGEDSSTIHSIEALKEGYEKETGTSISALGYSFEESFEKANVDFASGTGRYDIILQYNFSLSSFVRNNYVFALDELKKDMPKERFKFEDDLFGNTWQEVGHYYAGGGTDRSKSAAVGYPFAANTMVLAYNKDMFSSAENQEGFKAKYGSELTVPRTWEEFHAVAEFFTDRDRKTFGVCLQGSASGWLYYEWTNFAFGMGGGVMDKQRGWEGGDRTTPLLLNSPENIRATEFYVGLKPFNKGAFFDVDMNLQARLFAEGNVAMAIMWSDIIYPTISAEDGTFDTRFDFTTIPGEVSMLAGGAFFVNRNSKNPGKAFDFVLWLLEKDNQIEMTKKGLCSPLKSVYDAPEVADIPYIQAVKQSLERGVYMAEAGPDSEMISQKVGEYVQRAWKGDMTVIEALNRAQAEATAERAAIFDAVESGK